MVKKPTTLPGLAPSKRATAALPACISTCTSRGNTRDKCPVRTRSLPSALSSATAATESRLPPQ